MSDATSEMTRLHELSVSQGREVVRLAGEVKRLRAKVQELEATLERVIEAAFNVVDYVGLANYTSRQHEARQMIHDALKPPEDSSDE